MSNMNLVCGLDSRVAWWKFKLIDKERRLSRRFIVLLGNNFMQISVEIWALRDKVLHDDPNKSSAVYLLPFFDNKHAVCGTDFLPMQIDFFAENISDDMILLGVGDFRSRARQGKRSSFTDVHFGTST